jgi:threonine dehydrogenase-like Zn-dependent dehydrogenase
MQGLMFLEPGRLAWREVPVPRLESESDALVRPLAVARCDLDAAVVRGEAPFRGKALHYLRNHLPNVVGQKGLFRDAPFRGPYAFGHESVGEIIEVGSEVSTRRVGERVVVPFQIACGTCSRCRAGLTSCCEAVPARSMYGFGALGGMRWGGVLSDCVRVPFADQMLLPLPEGASPEALASAGDNVADGYRTVAGPLRARPGAEVLVVGGGAHSVALYAVACALALGASRVVYADVAKERLEHAARLGAQPVELPHKPRRLGRFPITVDASAHEHGLGIALRSTDHGGVCTSTGIYYASRTPVPLLDMYGTGLTFVTGRVDSRAVLPEVLALVASGKLRPERITTLVASWRDAAEAMLDPSVKVVVARPA